MIEVPKADPLDVWLKDDPPKWRPVRLANPADGALGRRSAHLSCPEGHVASLQDHTINASGRVEPSVICPADGCEFHDNVVLVGWEAS